MITPIASTEAKPSRLFIYLRREMLIEEDPRTQSETTASSRVKDVPGPAQINPEMDDGVSGRPMGPGRTAVGSSTDGQRCLSERMSKDKTCPSKIFII